MKMEPLDGVERANALEEDLGIPTYSVVIPIYNEAQTIPELYRRLEGVLAGLEASYEIVFVDDCSQDHSMELIKDLCAKNPRVKALGLSRNFGAQAAYTAGLDYASGEAVIIMDGDLQDPPELIPNLITKWKEGYEVVYAVKAKRHEPPLRRLALKVFYKTFSRLSYIPMPSDAGGFSIMSRRVVDVLRLMPEKSRLVSGMRAWIGYRQTGVAVEQDERFSGKSRQTPGKLIHMALDGLFSFSVIPIRAATWLGLLASGLALCAIVAVLVLRLLMKVFPVGWASLMIAVMFFGGIQLVFIGVLGEYICRIFEEVKLRPLYLVKEQVGVFPKGSHGDSSPICGDPRVGQVS